MAASPITYLTLGDICERWGVKPIQIAVEALEGKLTFSVPVPGIRAELGYYEEYGPNDWQRIPEARRVIRGVFDLYARDAWEIIKNKTKTIDSLVGENGGYIDLEPADHEEHFLVLADDLLIRRDEVDRFEASNAQASREIYEPPTVRGGPGARTKFDWDGFWIEVSRRIHDDGIPKTQGEMIRDLLDWFDKNGKTTPDQSTIKKKISRLWKSFHHQNLA
jgi:hypothetical protein